MEAKAVFLQLFEKLEAFADKLPYALQAPITKAATPVKDLFLKQRHPRFILTGDIRVSQAGLFNAIFAAPVAPFEPEQLPSLHSTGWQMISAAGRGGVQVFDARSKNSSTTNAVSDTIIRSALKKLTPDLILFLQPAEGSDPQLDPLEKLLEQVDSAQSKNEKSHTVLILPIVVSEEEHAPTNDRTSAERLSQLLTSRKKLAERCLPVIAVNTLMRFRLNGTYDQESDYRRNIPELVEVILSQLPDEAKLDMARLSHAKKAQIEIAQKLIHSVSLASGALGVQPIPLADLPFLLAFQVTMVSGIIYISGREMSLKLGSQFIGSIGANLGVGIVLRESARALSKLVPGWGNAISGTVAAGGTYAIGRAAMAYYIEGIPLLHAKKIFRTQQKVGSTIMRFLTRHKHHSQPPKALEDKTRETQ